MAETIEQVLQSLRDSKYADKRFNVFEVKAEEPQAGRVALTGRVLDEDTRQEIGKALAASTPQVDLSGLRVLRSPTPKILSVATNITSLHAQPSFMTEQVSQLLAGQRLEVLEEQGRWGYIRQTDGYLGWAYLPYLTTAEPLPASHVVMAPSAPLWSEPAGGELLGRVLGGTCVTTLECKQEYAQVAVYKEKNPQVPAQIPSGWLRQADLRGLDQLPVGEEACRKQMMADALTLLGVQYLWGGCAVNGIDCSGFAQLLHAWVGITIPRDADSQFLAGRPVEAPFRPGDLLFFGDQTEQGPRITHVTISTGGWNIIHSSRRRNGVNFDDVQAEESLRDSYLCACTFLG